MAKTLTAAAIRTLRASDQRQEIRDGGAAGLYLVVQPRGHKSFALRFRRPDGKPAKLVLGPFDHLRGGRRAGHRSAAHARRSAPGWQRTRPGARAGQGRRRRRQGREGAEARPASRAHGQHASARRHATSSRITPSRRRGSWQVTARAARLHARRRGDQGQPRRPLGRQARRRRSTATTSTR